MVAWRRGLLKGGYHKGIQYRVRRHMILGMVASELEAEYIQQMLSLTVAALAGHVNSKKIFDIYKDWSHRNSYALNKKEYDPAVFKSLEMLLQEFAKRAASTFSELKSSGVLELFDKKATAIHNRLHEEQ